MKPLIDQTHSIIPACDVTVDKYEKLVAETADIPEVSSYKVGFELGLAIGLPEVVRIARKYTQKPIIYDHQKAATDIPETGIKFARVLKEAGINAVILFPMAGPQTLEAWVNAVVDAEMHVIVGGWMTHPRYRASDGGYLSDAGVLAIYRDAARIGVTEFVVPGNNRKAIQTIRTVILAQCPDPILYSPGLVTQGGDLESASEAASGPWHAIVGRGIYEARDMAAAARELAAGVAAL